jgi:hypothetical protein
MIKVVLVLLAFVAVANAAAGTCTGYCTALGTNCGFPNSGYQSSAHCVAICTVFTTANVWAAGTDTDATGNTVGCRQYHAGAAAGSNTTHCPHASITGGDQCGSATDRCTNYCTLMGASCPAAYNDPRSSTFNATLCVANCLGQQGVAGFGFAYTAGAAQEFPYSTTGNTLPCRIYHATVASINSTYAAAHCGHASVSGGTVCGSTTQAISDWCDRLSVLCPSPLAPYSSAAVCKSTAAGYNASGFDTAVGSSIASGDNLACRFYHGGIPSAVDPTTHCAHAGYYSVPCGNLPTTAAPTTAKPTTPDSASTLVFSVVLAIIALVATLF